MTPQDLDKDDYIPPQFTQAPAEEVFALKKKEQEDRKKSDNKRRLMMKELGFESENSGEILLQKSPTPPLIIRESTTWLGNCLQAEYCEMPLAAGFIKASLARPVVMKQFIRLLRYSYNKDLTLTYIILFVFNECSEIPINIQVDKY